MLFNFALRPVDRIVPWGPVPHLGWFGLSDGWYWLDTGRAETFRYSQARRDDWAMRHPAREETAPEPPYLDYQVARLWMDILDILPDVLEPVPPKLAQLLRSPERFYAWEREAEAVATRTLPEREAWRLLDMATTWRSGRMLDTLYLQTAPYLWLWSDGDSLHIRWDARDCLLDGVPAWETPLEEHSMPVAAFLEEVHSFDARFIGQMERRIADIRAGWGRPDMALDLDEIAHEQRENAQRLSGRLAAMARREPAAWDDILGAIERIEALPDFAAGPVTRLL